MAAPAAFQRAFEREHEILGFLLDLDVAVAQQPEGALALDLEAGEQLVDEETDHRLQADEAQLGRIGVGSAEPDEALELPGDGDQAVHGLAVAVALHLDGEDEALVEDEREGMRRIDGDRGEDREVVGHEQALQPAALGGAQVLGLQDVDAGFGKLRLQLAPARLLVGDEARGKAVDGAQLLGGREAVLGHRLHAGEDLAVHAGDAHHVEFVEVGGRDRQEAQPLEQRVVLVAAPPRAPGD